MTEFISHYFCCSWTCRVRAEKDFCIVLYCSGYWDHLFVSQAYVWWAIIPQPSQPLTFGNVIFGCPASKFPATSREKRRLGIRHFFFGTQHLSRYIYIYTVYIYVSVYVYLYYNMEMIWYDWIARSVDWSAIWELTVVWDCGPLLCCLFLLSQAAPT